MKPLKKKELKMNNELQKLRAKLSAPKNQANQIINVQNFLSEFPTIDPMEILYEMDNAKIGKREV